MELYLITLAGAVFFAFCAERYPLGRRDLRQGSLGRVWVWILIVFLVGISGFRYQNYYLSDEYNYRQMVISTMGQGFDWTQIGLDKEWLFYAMVWISANVFHSDQALIFIAALITNVLVVLYFVRYAKPFWFAIFLYIAGGAFTTSMNVLRQYIAVAIILWCYPLAQKRKIIPYVILVAISAFIHQSAWIMLPMYFVLRRGKFDLYTVLVVVLSFAVLINFEAVMSVILPNTQYDNYLEDIIEGRYGVKWIRIAAWLVPYLILILFHRFFHIKCGVNYGILYAVLLAACISIVSSQYVFAARIEPYFTLIAFLGIIRIPELFVKKNERLVRILMVLLFFAFGLYQHLNSHAYHNVLLEDIRGVL